MPIKKILVPIDFSDSSLHALDYAIDLGRTAKADLLVLFVVEPVYYATPADLYGPSANLSLLVEEQQRIGRERLTDLTARLAKRNVQVRPLLETGVPYQAITERAEKLKADLIVMATHGRTGLAHLLLGSVTEKVVRSATCPVLTVRSPTPTGAASGLSRRKRRR